MKKTKIAAFLVPVLVWGLMVFPRGAGAWKSPSVSGGTGMSAEAFGDSLFTKFPFIQLPVMPDTSKSELDSLTVLLLADTANLPVEYATHLHAYGNGTDPADSLFLVRAFIPPKTDPDSVYWWVKSSAVTADSVSYGVTFSRKTSSEETVFTQTYLSADTANTWERRAFAFDAFSPEQYDLTVRFRIRAGHGIWISPVYFK